MNITSPFGRENKTQRDLKSQFKPSKPNKQNKIKLHTLLCTLYNILQEIFTCSRKLYVYMCVGCKIMTDFRSLKFYGTLFGHIRIVNEECY